MTHTDRPDYVDTLYRLAQGADYPDRADPPRPPALRHHAAEPMPSALHIPQPTPERHACATDPLDADPYEPPHAFFEGLLYGLLLSSVMWGLGLLVIAATQPGIAP